MSFRHKKIIMLLLFVLANVGLLKPVITFADHEIVASVNDKPISKSDLNQKTKLLLLFSGQPLSAENKAMFEKEALKMIIREMMQMQFIEKLGVKFSDKEYADALERIEIMNGEKPGFLTQLAKDNGIAESILRLSVMANYAWELFISERYKSNIQPSQLSIDSRLTAVKKNRNKPHIRIAEIVLPFDSSATEQTAKETAQSIIEMLHEGATFITLVQQFSKGPSAVNGGDLGWMIEADFESEVQKALNGLSPNQVTPPVRTQNAYKILFVIDRREKSPEPKPLTVYTYAQAFIPKPKTATEAEGKKLKDTALAVQQNARSEAMLRGFLKNVVGHQVKVFDHKEEKEISPAILKQIKDLKPGATASLIERPEGYYVILLMKKELFTGEDLIRQNVESELKYQRLMIFSQKEMQNVRRKSHVEIRASEFQGLKY